MTDRPRAQERTRAPERIRAPERDAPAVSMDAARVEACQTTPRPVAVLTRSYANGAATGRHRHPRGQALYATEGLMMALTDNGAWALPSGHALLIPPDLPHEVSMHGRVEMLTAYVLPERAGAPGPFDLRVVRVSPLLDASLRALAEEPLLYDEAGRGGHLAAIVLDEFARAEIAPFALPLPRDHRLRGLCQRLLDDPSLPDGLDAWADAAAMSRRTLTRRFRDETGLSIGEWRRQLRQLHGFRLRAEGATLKEVAPRVGYRSPQAYVAMTRRGA